MTIQEIPLQQLQPSPYNPRKTFHQPALDELAESIKTTGVLQPITVRPLESVKRGAVTQPRYEIVAGERRYRATQQAGLKTIPAIVRELDDRAAFEIAVVENLQRVDVDPLDESAGFDMMISKQGWPVEEIATRIGKSVPYVYQRLSLRNLAPAVTEALATDSINLTKALILARMHPDDQLKVLHVAQRRSAKDLRETIEQEIMCRLKDSAFADRLMDKTLLPPAGSCIDCTSRSGARQSLFPEYVDDDRCLDRPCFEKKTQIALRHKLETHLRFKVGPVVLAHWELPKWAEEPLKEANVEAPKRWNFEFDECEQGEEGAIQVGQIDRTAFTLGWWKPRTARVPYSETPAGRLDELQRDLASHSKLSQEQVHAASYYAAIQDALESGAIDLNELFPDLVSVHNPLRQLVMLMADDHGLDKQLAAELGIDKETPDPIRVAIDQPVSIVRYLIDVVINEAWSRGWTRANPNTAWRLERLMRLIFPYHEQKRLQAEAEQAWTAHLAKIEELKAQIAELKSSMPEAPAEEEEFDEVDE